MRIVVELGSARTRRSDGMVESRVECREAGPVSGTPNSERKLDEARTEAVIRRASPVRVVCRAAVAVGCYSSGSPTRETIVRSL